MGINTKSITSIAGKFAIQLLIMFCMIYSAKAQWVKKAGFGAAGTTPSQITPALAGTSDPTRLPNINYDTPNTATAPFSYSNISCGVGFNEGMKGKGLEPLSANTNMLLDSTECGKLVWAMHSLDQGGDYQKMYDSGRYLIEHCSNRSHYSQFDIWDFFGGTSTGVQYLSNDPNRFPPFREWLKKVLYLNMDTNYYCSDVFAISQSFRYFNAERGYDVNGALAITKFLLDSHRCFSYWGDLNKVWKESRLDQYQRWQDTVKDSLKTPLDTNLPSLEFLNLQILRGPQYAAVKNAFTPSTLTKIKYLNVSENPFKKETTLRFGLADAEYMKIEIFDLLGNKIYSDSKLFGEGDGEWKIDGKTFARGALYARLSTMGGEVKTVKLIHEK